jgi:hypothetical protein
MIDIEAIVDNFMGEYGCCADMRGEIEYLALEYDEETIQETLGNLLRLAYERGAADLALPSCVECGHKHRYHSAGRGCEFTGCECRVQEFNGKPL